MPDHTLAKRNGQVPVVPSFAGAQSGLTRFALHLKLGLDGVIHAGRLLRGVWEEHGLRYQLSNRDRVQILPGRLSTHFAREGAFHRALADNNLPIKSFWSLPSEKSLYISPTIVQATIQLGHLYEVEVWTARQAAVPPTLIFHVSHGSNDWHGHRAPLTHPVKTAVLRKAFAETAKIHPTLGSDDKAKELIEALNQAKVEIASGTSDRACVVQVLFSTPPAQLRRALVQLYEQVS